MRKTLSGLALGAAFAAGVASSDAVVGALQAKVAERGIQETDTAKCAAYSTAFEASEVRGGKLLLMRAPEGHESEFCFQVEGLFEVAE